MQRTASGQPRRSTILATVQCCSRPQRNGNWQPKYSDSQYSRHKSRCLARNCRFQPHTPRGQEGVGDRSWWGVLLSRTSSRSTPSQVGLALESHWLHHTGQWLFPFRSQSRPWRQLRSPLAASRALVILLRLAWTLGAPGPPLRNRLGALPSVMSPVTLWPMASRKIGASGRSPSWQVWDCALGTPS